MWGVLVNDGNASSIGNGKQKECIKVNSQRPNRKKVLKRLHLIPRTNNAKNLQHGCQK